MNKIIVTLLLAVCMTVGMRGVPVQAQEDTIDVDPVGVDTESVEINDTNFTDEAFRNYVSDNFDKAGFGLRGN